MRKHKQLFLLVFFFWVLICPNGRSEEGGFSLAPFEGQAALHLEEALQKLMKKSARQGKNGMPGGLGVKYANADIPRIPLKKQVCQVEKSIERLRMLAPELAGRYILVNIPDFKLDLVENGKILMSMKVIVGRIDRPSPTLDAMMTYLVFSPTWRVPPKIAVRDKLPLLQRDPAYLEKQGMKLYEDHDGELIEVNPQTVNWKYVSTDNFPYRLIQDPGDLNALGLVKFMFPNEHDVYLHDTPEKELFNHTVRAFSSGCFRIEKPLELAEYLLRDKPGWDRPAVIAAMQSGNQQMVGLKNPLPVHIVYLTAWVDAQNRLNLRKDIYNKDVCYY